MLPVARHEVVAVSWSVFHAARALREGSSIEPELQSRATRINTQFVACRTGGAANRAKPASCPVLRRALGHWEASASGWHAARRAIRSDTARQVNRFVAGRAQRADLPRLPRPSRPSRTSTSSSSRPSTTSSSASSPPAASSPAPRTCCCSGRRASARPTWRSR